VIDVTCSLALLVATLVVVPLAYTWRVARAGTVRHTRIERAGSSPLLGTGPMHMGYWAMIPMARACIALGVSANAVSWLSLVSGVAAGASIGLSHLGVGAVLAVVSSVCDALDGMIARETGTASDSGEVLDATVDRYVELSFLGGVALHERADAPALGLAFAATTGAVMVSYATAKAEALHVEAPRGAMRRPERAVYLILGVALAPITSLLSARWSLPARFDDLPALTALALVAAVGNASAVRRLYCVARSVRKREEFGANGATRKPAGSVGKDGHAVAGDAIR
jgi:CDP-diacylglycerol--glycerol-3-phosphate 3-phosphatidyltransferase